MDKLILNLQILFNTARLDNLGGNGTNVSRMVTTYIPDAIQEIQILRGVIRGLRDEWSEDCYE